MMVVFGSLKLGQLLESRKEVFIELLVLSETTTT